MKKLILLVTTALLWFSMYIYNPYIIPELLALKVSASVAGIIVGARPFMEIFIRLPIGLASDRTGRHKNLVIFGNAFSAAAAFCMFLWPSAAMITVGCIITGFASATYVGYTVLFGSYFPKGRTSSAMGLIGTVEYGAICAGFVAGGILYKSEGIRTLFLIAAIAGAAGTLAACTVQDTKLPPAKEDRADIRKVFSNQALLISSVLSILLKLAAFGTAFTFTTKVAQDMGDSGVRLGVATGTYIAASAAGSLFVASKTARSIGHIRLCLAGFALMALNCAVLPFATNYVLFLVLQALGGLSFGALSAILMSNAVRTLPLNQKTAGMGVYQSLYCIGMAFGSIVVGIVADASSYTAGYLSMAAACAAGFLLVIYAARKKLIRGRIERTETPESAAG